jgi:signal transduction histidine kinase
MGLELKFVLGIVMLVVGSGITCYALAASQTYWVAPLLLVGAFGLTALSVAHYSLFRPLQRIVAMARAVGAGNFTKRLGLERHDEIGSLALELDTLCDQLEAAERSSDTHIAALEQLRHSDRVATLGRLASSVAHELGNPLNVIELRAQLIVSGEAGSCEEARQSALVIVEQTRRMTRIIDEILSFARTQPALLTSLDLAGVLHKAIALSSHTAKQRKASIQLELHQHTIDVDGDADKLVQLLVNLLVNGVQASPGGGTLRVITSEVQRPPIDDPEGPPQPYVCIDVVDQGPGIPELLLPKVFEPFFSTKQVQGGTGLGLSIAQGIAREHEGWIAATSELGVGSTFKVHVPQRGSSSVGGHAN